MHGICCLLRFRLFQPTLAQYRNTSPDGWTRQFNLNIAVSEPEFWELQKRLIEKQLRFLTTDIWNIHFLPGGHIFQPNKEIIYPDEEGIILLSGGLDSLIGAIDITANDKKLFAVSQVVRGDREKQLLFARTIRSGMNHIQMNHNANIPGKETPPTQRARSVIFLAYGTLIATSLQRYKDGETIKLYVCENGFIAINPPLTDGRIGSLSTRTAHPLFLHLFQQLIDVAGLRVKIENPYRFKTKGEMLIECMDQKFLTENAYFSTSCGRFGRMRYRQCGRCVPCLIRRASFIAWGVHDKTEYVYSALSKNDPDHSGFDDVRSAAMAVEENKDQNICTRMNLNFSINVSANFTHLQFTRSICDAWATEEVSHEEISKRS